MSNIRAMRKQVEQMIQQAQPVKAKDLIVFVGSEEVIVNGEWLTYQEFKKRYSEYISDDWEVNIIGWNKRIKSYFDEMDEIIQKAETLEESDKADTDKETPELTRGAEFAKQQNEKEQKSNESLKEIWGE